MSRRFLSSLARALPFQYNGTTLAISKANVGFVPEAVSGTPAQHALYRENVVKGWANVDFAGIINDSFNLTSITDVGTGDILYTWDRDFANAIYAVSAITLSAGAISTVLKSQAAGTTGITSWSAAGAALDGSSQTIITIGDQ